MNFTPNAGHEQGGRRPALVLSPKDYNIRSGLMIVVPVTSKVKGYPFEVQLSPGMKLEGVALSDQIRSVDWVARKAEFHTEADNEFMCEVLGRIEAILSIDCSE